jgi:hypothetical protein
VNVKSLTLLCTALLACSAFAQIKPEEEQIQTAFAGLRVHPGLQITMDGTQKIGDNTTTFKTIAYWFQDIEDGRPMTKLEMLGYVNGTEKFRIVGDGITLWAYDEARNEYSASRYGTYKDGQPTAYVNDLLSSLRSLVKGQSSFVGRMLGEVYGGEEARYTTWLPGTNIENTGAVVRYVLGNPVHRSLEFWYTSMPPNMVLNHIDYFDEVSFGDQNRDLDWTITLLSFDLALTDTSFQFIPPTGSRAVAGVRPVTGG